MAGSSVSLVNLSFGQIHVGCASEECPGASQVHWNKLPGGVRDSESCEPVYYPKDANSTYHLYRKFKYNIHATFIHPSNQSVRLSPIHLFVHLFIHPSVCLSIHLQWLVCRSVSHLFIHSFVRIEAPTPPPPPTVRPSDITSNPSPSLPFP